MGQLAGFPLRSIFSIFLWLIFILEFHVDTVSQKSEKKTSLYLILVSDFRNSLLFVVNPKPDQDLIALIVFHRVLRRT